MASRAEEAMATLVTEFEGITIANGYRNDVEAVVKAIRPPQNITTDNEIGIEFGDSVLEFKDSARTICDEIITVDVVAVVKTDLNDAQEPENANILYEASEKMAHDLRKKITADILTKYIAGVSNRFNVELSNNRLVVGRAMLLGAQRSIGIIDTSFKIRIRAQNSTFE